MLGLAACGGQGEPETGVTTRARDSAGILIVENAGPGWGESGWRVADTPSVDIGGAAAGPESEFSRVVGTARLSDGRLAVANVATSEVRWFDPAGAFIQASGRQGSGPGEFQLIGGMWPGVGDSVLVADLRAQRLTVLDGSGAYARSFALGGRAGLQVGERGVSLALPQGWLADGGVVGLEMPLRVNEPRDGAYRDTVTVVRFDANGAVLDTVGRFPGIEMVQSVLTFAGQTVPTPNPVPLGRQTVVGVSGRAVFVATNDAWEIQERSSSGRLVRLVRLAAPDVPVTDEDVATHRAEQLELMEGLPELRNVPPDLKEQIVSRVRTTAYPSTFPYVVGLLTSPDGHLWVQEVTRPGDRRARFAVFDSTGAFLGRVRMPERFQPSRIGDAEVVGIWRDADDVEHVRVYPIDRTASP